MSEESIQATVGVLKTLVPVATSVSVIIGGVNVPVTQGLLVVQALLPVVDEFIIGIGDNKVAIDTKNANDINAIISVLGEEIDKGFPRLSFIVEDETN